jgi:hypothetical protein
MAVANAGERTIVVDEFGISRLIVHGDPHKAA